MNQTQKNYFEYQERQVRFMTERVEEAKEVLARELEDYAKKLRQDRFYSTDPRNLHGVVDNFTDVVQRKEVAVETLEALKRFNEFGEEDQPE